MLRRFGQTPQIKASSLIFGRHMMASRALAAAPTLTMARRSIATDKISPNQEQDILVQQRKNRPMSPHLEIYQPQLTWYLSGLHRITGVALGFAFYAGLVAYAGFPLIGFPFTYADVTAYWATMPGYIKLATKSLIAFPLTFHSWNGIRHLIWDTGRELTLKGVYRTGYAVLGLSVLTSLGLALL